MDSAPTYDAFEYDRLPIRGNNPSNNNFAFPLFISSRGNLFRGCANFNNYRFRSFVRRLCTYNLRHKIANNAYQVPTKAKFKKENVPIDLHGRRLNCAKFSFVFQSFQQSNSSEFDFERVHYSCSKPFEFRTFCCWSTKGIVCNSDLTNE